MLLALDPIVGALALAIATALCFSQEKGSEQTFHNVAEELSFSFDKPATSIPDRTVTELAEEDPL